MRAIQGTQYHIDPYKATCVLCGDKHLPSFARSYNGKKSIRIDFYRRHFQGTYNQLYRWAMYISLYIFDMSALLKLRANN